MNLSNFASATNESSKNLTWVFKSSNFRDGDNKNYAHKWVMTTSANRLASSQQKVIPHCRKAVVDSLSSYPTSVG